MRPNQIFTLPLLDEKTSAGVVVEVTNRLTYEYGVASLSQTDEDFHPYHQYPPYYPKDAAYHSGTVWTWLQGPLISALCRFGKQDFARELTANAAHRILDRGAVGTQSELLDAVPRKGETEPQPSGTFSQAWNLAEFVRNFYEDYLGYHPDLLNREIAIQAHIPRQMGKSRLPCRLEMTRSNSTSKRRNSPMTLSIDAEALSVDLSVALRIPAEGGRIINTRFSIPAHQSGKVELKDTNVTLYLSKSKPIQCRSNSLDPPALPEPLAFLHPQIRDGLHCTQRPGISHDPARDDKGYEPRLPTPRRCI